MPRRKQHVDVGGAVGVFFSTALGLGQPDQFLEIVCGTIGGIGGGRMPDVLEPAVSPRHRDVAHSLSAGIGFAAAAHTNLLHWQDICVPGQMLVRGNVLAISGFTSSDFAPF